MAALAVNYLLKNFTKNKLSLSKNTRNSLPPKQKFLRAAFTEPLIMSVYYHPNPGLFHPLPPPPSPRSSENSEKSFKLLNIDVYFRRLNSFKGLTRLFQRPLFVLLILTQAKILNPIQGKGTLSLCQPLCLSSIFRSV